MNRKSTKIFIFTEMKPPETKPSIEETDMLPPQRGTPSTRRNQQAAIEKTTVVKTKRVLT